LFSYYFKEYWNIPEWIDESKLNKSISKIGFTLDYRRMCRFNAGYFFRHKLTLKYDFFMRMDSDSVFQCEFSSDPFRKFQNEKMKFGFILSDQERMFTIPSLWRTVKKWAKNSSIKLNKNGLKFISDYNGKAFNNPICIVYANFIMGDFSVFRNNIFLEYFDFLDKTGGFFYERWASYFFVLSNLRKFLINLFLKIIK
jgi:alpha 1,2-mannosyltransferase